MRGRFFGFMLCALCCSAVWAGQARAADPVLAGGLEIAVNTIRTHASLTNEFGETINPANGAFLAANLSITNNGAASQQLEPGMFRLKDSQGTTYVATAFSEKRLFSHALGPGGAVQGTVVFDGPSDTAGLALVFVATKPAGGALLAEMALVPSRRPAIPNEIMAPGRRATNDGPGTTSAPVSLSGPIETGRFSVVIEGAEVRHTQRETGRRRRHVTRSVLVTVRFAVQNNDAAPQRLEPGMFRLRDAGGREYPAHFHTDKKVFETEIAPGTVFRGAANFELAVETQGLSLILDSGAEKHVDIYPAPVMQQ